MGYLLITQLRESAPDYILLEHADRSSLVYLDNRSSKPGPTE